MPAPALNDHATETAHVAAQTNPAAIAKNVRQNSKCFAVAYNELRSGWEVISCLSLVLLKEM
jgi:hypothetical protein